MRLALIADIHGNGTALECVLDDLGSADIDCIVCLGDVATDGPQPHQVVARLKALNGPVVMGNMDRWILSPPARPENPNPLEEIEHWGAAQLSAADREYLRTFKKTVRLSLNPTTDLLCYHGCPHSDEKGIGPNTTDEKLAQRLEGCDAALLAGGHTHRQMFRPFGEQVVLNPGTVGASMPPNAGDRRSGQARPLRAEYAIVDASENAFKVEFRRVPLDGGQLIEAALESGMPHTERWLELRYGLHVE